jgi:RNA polymerase sigma-70 factor, ECF subfamily
MGGLPRRRRPRARRARLFLTNGSAPIPPIVFRVTDHPPPADFRALFEGEFTYVWCALRRLGVREDDVEDLVHEVFLNVYRHLSDYDHQRPVRPWLFGFAFRVASDHRRRAHHRREVVGAEMPVTDPRARADDEIARHQDSSLLLAALDEIDLDRRAVLVLHEWDEETIPEVARALGIPVNTAYTRLRTGREELAGAVKRLAARRGR